MQCEYEKFTKGPQNTSLQCVSLLQTNLSSNKLFSFSWGSRLRDKQKNINIQSHLEAPADDKCMVSIYFNASFSITDPSYFLDGETD